MKTELDKNVKIMAVSSIGGHWIQLLRIIKPLEETMEVVYMSTHSDCRTMVEGHSFYSIQDFSRWDAYKIIPVCWKTLRIIAKESPNVIITTGAAPGLIALLSAKLLGKKTIWIDSVANVEKLSLSGKIASKFASRIYTQWKHLANEQVHYAGNVFG